MKGLELVFLLLGIASIYLASYLTMVWGWGLEPENLGWIIAGYIYTASFSVFSAIVKEL